MSINTFRDLDAWHVAMDFTETIYRVTSRLPQSEQFELGRQLRRAAVSVPSNIAEGHAPKLFGRNRHHLRLALGSVAEISTQLELGCRLGYFPRSEWSQLEKEVERLNQLIAGLIRSTTRRMQAGWTSSGALLLALISWLTNPG